MCYELYVDRLFGMWLCMHLLLLLLTAAAGRLKLSLGRALVAAAAGSFIFLLVFLWPLGNSAAAKAGKLLFQIAGSFLMLRMAFGIDTANAIIRAGGIFGLCAVLLGGAMTALFKEKAANVRQILGAGVFLSLAGIVMTGRERQKDRGCMYTVILYEGKRSIKLTALLDSGNSLRDPISAQPVCVVHQSVIEALGLSDMPERFRAIPYHSVGRQHGILHAWIVGRMELYIRGQRRTYYRVVLAESGQLSENKNYRMLLHPALLEEKGGEKHDFKSCNAGKDAV